MISLIAAVGKNNELGLDNHLIFNIPGDLKFFRNTTLGKTVIMGRKTYESIGKPLPKRINIVVSNSLKETDGITIINSFEEVLEKYLNSEEEVFIIGGESLYNYFINYAQNIYLTKVYANAVADKYFPSFDENNYNQTLLGENKENNLEYKHILYRRKNER
ncbi:MAG: dihydrofolate reductase [Mycoplasma sp.]|jgi:dihydrofolate reductase|nr:dihydrofolate reductase [Mycoplasma sp.]MDD7150202.1 dihydrofolate reductase [Mycoplasma sp.]MDY4543719.1 dihydrofolate reductase [Bacilli bacterium]MDY4619023.1 dihydrofolate reductase [Bacilli bacterium]CDE37518.1 dihydrofolate reductase [Mycoplasma sp. CAG:472]